MNIRSAIFPKSEIRSSLFFSTLSICISSVLIFLTLAAYFAANNSSLFAGDKSQYYTLTKPIGLSNTLFGSSSSFNENEILELNKQSFTKNLSPIRKSKFLCRASFFQNQKFQSEIILESMPNDFIDGPVYKFYWDDEMKTVPIILSAQFLQLYNLVYAPVAGLPPVSSENLSLVPITLLCSSAQGNRRFNAEIIGLSNRFTGLFVPDAFLKSVNKNLTGSASSRMDKIVINVNQEYVPDFEKFIDSKAYEINSEKLRIGKSASLIYPLLFGLLVLFSAFILIAISNFWLQWKWIIEEQKQNISLLYFLGVRPSEISKTIFIKLLPYLGVSFITSIAIGLGFVYSFSGKFPINIDSLSFPYESVCILAFAYFLISASLYFLLLQFSKKAYV